MFEIRYNIDDIDEFIHRKVGATPVDLEERDRTLAEMYPTYGEMFYAGESFGRLWLGAKDSEMEVAALGATIVLHELMKGAKALTGGSGSFQADDPGGGYGVSLRLDRKEDQLQVTRTMDDVLAGPSSATTTWPAFARAVDDYIRWYHTEYLVKASWLLRVEFVQELRREAGYPSDHF